MATIQGPNYWYGTGPSEDHTSGSGSYLLLDTAKPKKKGDNALFHSTWLMKNSDGVNAGKWNCGGNHGNQTGNYG